MPHKVAVYLCTGSTSTLVIAFVENTTQEEEAKLFLPNIGLGTKVVAVYHLRGHPVWSAGD